MFLRSEIFPKKSGNTRGFPPLAVALQGGGAYGAYSWGVLDRLLQEEDILPAAISGASAGAVNAVLTAFGILQGGRDGARALLRQFWAQLGKQSLLSPMALPGADLQFDLWTRLFSPTQVNPFNFNPLRDLLAGMIDFGALRDASPVALFLSATDIATGAPHIFRETEVTLDMVMASACLPTLSQAVEIGGRHYWDGGLSANPPILPLVLETECRSLLVIKLTPDMDSQIPTKASEILARLRRILLNTSLERELKVFEDMRGLLAAANPPAADLVRLRDLTVRQIAIDAKFFAAGGSALSSRPDFLERLFDAGSEAAQAILTPAADMTESD